MRKAPMKFIALAIVMLLGLLLSAPICMGAEGENFGEQCADVLMVSGTSEKIHMYGEIPQLELRLSNPDAKVVSVVTDYEVLDENGVLIWSHRDTRTMQGYQSMVWGQPLDSPVFGYGMYTVKISITVDDVTVVKKINFSVAVKNTELSCKTGLQIFNINETSMDQALSLADTGGFGTVRFPIRWTSCERQKGIVSMPVYEDTFVRKILDMGMNVILVIMGTNPLYDATDEYPDGRFPVSNEGITAYANVCKTLAQTYGDKVCYEIWNEPETPNTTGGYVISAQEYANVLKAAYEAIKSVNKNAVVIGGSTVSTIEWYSTTFLEELFDDDVKGYMYMDAVSVHPYLTDYQTGREKNPYFDEHYRFSFQQHVMSKLYDLIENSHRPELPVWISEIGVSSHNGVEKPYRPLYTEEEQAINLVRLGIMTYADDRIEKVIFHRLRNSIEEDKYDGYEYEDVFEYNFGLLKKNGEMKPAYLGMSAMNMQMNGMMPVKELSNVINAWQDRVFSRYAFENKEDGNYVFVLWTNKAKDTTASVTIQYDATTDAPKWVDSIEKSHADLTLMIPENMQYQLIDMKGNPIAKQESFVIGQAPCYLRVSKNNVDIAVSEEGQVVINGTSPIPHSQIVIAVCKNGIVRDKLCFMHQTKADIHGNFSAQFHLSNKFTYQIYVNDGISITEKTVNGSAYDTDIQLYDEATGTKVSSTNMLNNIKKLKAIMSVKSKDAMPSDEKVTAFIGEYDAEGSLVDVHVVSGSFEEGRVKFECMIDLEKDIPKIKIFLMKDKLMPIMSTFFVR